MITCDFCNKELNIGQMNTIILQKRPVTYCNREKCRNKAKELIEEFSREQKYEYLEYERALVKKEKIILKKWGLIK